ncbi:MAG: glycosyltransferase family 2 protein [Desulfitobacteriaceae bacterium]
MKSLFDTASPEISVILPTLRPEKAWKCIENIASSSEGINYEVVVVSPLNMRDLLVGCKGYQRIIFVLEKNKEGSCKANTLGYENATGKYIFALADDHRLGQDCLKNLLEFMRPHDHERFLAGARCYGVYGAAPECKTYGFYYAFNPCIQKNVVKHVGGFYDPYYKSYYGDPDLSMRVWHSGGKVELCPDAWVEFHNEFDDVDFESHDDYAERDFNAFFKRWHPIYGHLVNSNNEKDINIGNKYTFPGIPPEKCTRLIVFLRKKDWSALKKELDSENNILLNRDNLFYVLEDILKHLDWIFIPIDIQQDLSKWLIKQLITQTSFEESETLILFESQNRSSNSYESSNIILAKIAIFLLVKSTLKRDPEIIVENYKGINIIYSSQKYYAWPSLYGGFSIREFKKMADNIITFCKPEIYQVIMKIDESTEGSFLNWQKIREIEDFISSSKFDLLPNVQNSRLILENLPDEICLKLMFCLRFQDWNGIESLLNNLKETFFIRNHIAFVYYEILRNINQIPSHIVLLLSQWLWNELYFSSISVQNMTEEQDHSNVRLVVHGYRHYNIVYNKGLYYGWPLSAGGFSLEGYMNGIASEAVVGKSPLEVKRLIDGNSALLTHEDEQPLDWITIQQDEAVITSCETNDDLDNDIRLVVHGYRRYNFVYCKGLYYGWPWPAGRFSLMRYLNGFDRAAVAGILIMDVKTLIDQKLGPPTAEEENQHDWIAIQQMEAANFTI